MPNVAVPDRSRSTVTSDVVGVTPVVQLYSVILAFGVAVMVGLFFWLFHGPWLKFKRAVDASDWPTAGASLNDIRQIIAVNLPLGLIVVIVGASGRYW